MNEFREVAIVWWTFLGSFVQESSWRILVAWGLLLIVFYYVFRISVRLFFMFLFELQQRIRGKVMERVRLSSITPTGKRVLIAGDSTAVGKGSRSILETVEGRLETDFPATDVFNVSMNGALTRDILKQVDQPACLQYDLIILSTGGSDLWSSITMATLTHDLRTVLRFVKPLCRNQVVVIFFGNIGSAPLFPCLIRRFLLWRGQRVLNVFQEVCHSEQVELLELFTGASSNPFTENPKRYFALDGLHPNGEGYLLWYNLIKEVILNKEYLKGKR